MRAWDPHVCVCVGALLQERESAAAGKGHPAGTTPTPPTAQEHKTISLGSVPISSPNEL